MTAERSLPAQFRRRWPHRAIGIIVPAMIFVVAQTGMAKDPAGIYALLPSYNSERPFELTERPVWNNPLVQGVTVRTVWKNVQPTEKGPDWKFFDDAVTAARLHGKKVGLSLAAGIFTPPWVYASGAQPFDFTLKGPWRETEAKAMPEPWDPAFQRLWGSVVVDMGKRYDGDPTVAYVMVGGLGFSIESFYVKTREDTAKLARMGGPEKWLRGSTQIIDLYAAAFPHKPFVLAMATPVREGGMDWLRKLVEYGMQKYPGRFGVMYHGLTAEADPGSYLNTAVRDFSTTSPTGFQMIWSSEGEEGKQRLRGSLDQALERAVELKAHFVEVYEVDCQNPTFRDKISETSRALLRNADPR